MHRWKGYSHAILFVDDLPIDQANALDEGIVDDESYEVERRIFELFDVLCVYGAHAKRLISARYGIPNENFVEVEFRDNWVDVALPAPKSFPQDGIWRMVYIGSGEKAYAGEWPLSLEQAGNSAYEFIGDAWEWIDAVNRPDMVRYPSMEADRLSLHLAEHSHFGIVAYSEKMNQYCKYICPSKFATYLSIGLPVITLSSCENINGLVSKYGIGFSVDSFGQLSQKLNEITPGDYQDMRNRCLMLSERVRCGYYFKRAVREGIRMFGGTEQGFP